MLAYQICKEGLSIHFGCFSDIGGAMCGILHLKRPRTLMFINQSMNKRIYICWKIKHYTQTALENFSKSGLTPIILI